MIRILCKPRFWQREINGFSLIWDYFLNTPDGTEIPPLPPLITLAPNQGFLTDWPLHPVSLAESPSNQGSDGKLQVAARLVKLKELEVATPCDRPNLQLSSQRGSPYSVPLG